MSKKDGFYLYFDWEKPFDRLSDEDLGKITRAMIKYVKHGEEPPDFDGNAALIADFVFPQLARSMQYAKNGALGGKTTQEKQMVEPMVEPTVEPLNINKDINLNKNINIPQKPPVGADVYGERFDVFWNAYPRKNGKGAAEKAFKKIKPSGELLQKMLDAIVVQKQSDQWRRDNGQYIPNPATWLNQTRWEDEGTAQPNNQDITLAEFFS